jgi:hypothetical protein
VIGLSFTSLADLRKWLSGAIDKDSLDCCRGGEIQERHVNSLLSSKYYTFQANSKKGRQCMKNQMHFSFDSVFCGLYEIV